MSTVQNIGNIVTNGLSFYLDAANNTSYVSGSTSWIDLTRNAITNTTLINGPGFDTAGIGSITLDGVDDFVSCSFASPRPTFASGSLCLWVYPKTGSMNSFNVYTSGNPLGSYDIMLGKNQFGKLRGYVYDPSPINTSRWMDSKRDVTLNAWNYAVLTWKAGDSVKIYLNGILENSSYLGLTQNNTAGLLRMLLGPGGPVLNAFHPPYGYFNGNMGICQIYNRDLTAGEVLQNYNSHKGRYNSIPSPPPIELNPGPYTGSIEINTSSLAMYYDASIYNSYPLTGTFWYDISGNNRHASLYNHAYTSSNSGAIMFREETYGDTGTSSFSLGITDQGTWGGWMKPLTTSPGPTLIGDWSIDGMIVKINSGLASSDFYIYPGNYRITYSYPYVTGSWYNLVGVASGSTMLFYLNGNFAASRSLATNIGMPAGNIPLKIGLRGDGRDGPSTMDIANVYVYTRALSSQEVLQNYSASKDRFGL